MNNEELIRKGLEIATQTKSYVIGKNILGQVPEVYNKHFSGKKALVVADDNTWKAAGEEVYKHPKLIARPCECPCKLSDCYHGILTWKQVQIHTHCAG